MGSEMCIRDRLITLDIKGIKVKAVSPFIPDVKIEEKLWVSFNLNKSHIFDKKRGEAIFQKYNRDSNSVMFEVDELISRKEETIKEV